MNLFDLGFLGKLWSISIPARGTRGQVYLPRKEHQSSTVSKLLFLAAKGDFESGENEINPFLDPSLIPEFGRMSVWKLDVCCDPHDHNTLFSSQKEHPQSPPAPPAPAPPL